MTLSLSSVRAVALASLCAATAAQFPTVVPNVHANNEGPGASEAPGDWVPLHMQSIYANTGILAWGVIQRIDWRRDGSAVAFTAHTKTMTVWLSSQGVDVPEYSSAHFRYNRGTDFQQVFTGTVNYPAEAPVTNPPAAFTLQLPVNPTFNLAPLDNLLVEVAVQGTTFAQAGWKGDSTAGVAYAPEGVQFATGNAGCPATFLDGFLGNKPWPGAPLVLSSPSGATGPAPGISVIGFPYPSPISLAPIGAPGCALVQDTALTLPLVTAANGVAEADWGKLPKSPFLANRNINIQTFVVDLSFNTLGLRVSEGTVLGIGTGFPAGLESMSWYNRRDNSTGLSPRADFRSSRAPIIRLN